MCCLASSIGLFAGVRRALCASSLREEKWPSRHIGLSVVEGYFMRPPPDTRGAHPDCSRQWRIAF